MKKSLLILTALAAGGAFAADIPWDPETKAYDLGADDVITFSANQTINGDYTFTGSGTIKQTAGELKLSYTPLTAGYPFINFAGRIVIENAVLNGDFGLHGEGENGQANHSLGENSTLVLKNATFSPLARNSNNTFLPSIVVNPGDNGEGSKLDNTLCRSANAGAHVTITGALSGAGDLMFEGRSRKLELQGNNAGYSGALTVIGLAGDGFIFRNANSGSADASFDHNRPERIYIHAKTGETIALGALTTGEKTDKIDIANRGPIVEIGAREGRDSTITVPFWTNPATIRKVGDTTTFTFTEAVTFPNDTILEAKAGTVQAGACNLSNVVVRLTAGVPVKLGENVTVALNADGNPALTGSGEVRVGKFEADGMSKIVIGEGVTLLLGCSQTITRTMVEGEGDFGFCGGRMTLDVQSDYFTMDGPKKLVLAGVEVYAGTSNGANIDIPLEIAAGTTNKVHATNANLTIRDLTGSGYLDYYSDEKRGPQVKGDCSGFAGTLRLWGGWRKNAPPTGWYGNAAGSANAVWILNQDWYVGRDGDMSYTFFDQDLKGEALKFGAMIQEAPDCRLRAGSTRQVRDGMKIEVGAREDVDSVINGKFTCSRVALKKVGAGSCLTLGTGFGAVANSTLDIAEGTLGFNLPGEDGAVTTLTDYSVTIAEGVKVRVAMTAEQFSALKRNAGYEVAKLPSNPGFKPETELYVDGVAAEQLEGVDWKVASWKVRFESRAATETAAAYTAAVLRYRPSSITIIVR